MLKCKLFSSLLACVFVITGAPVGSPIVVNECLYGDMSNSSFLQTTSTLEGKILWSKPTGNKEAIPAQHIILVDESVLIRFSSRLNCFNIKDGKLKWSEWLGNNFKFQIIDGMVRTRLPGGNIGAIGCDGKKIPERYVYMIGDETFLFYFTENAHEDDFCYSLLPHPTSGPGENGVTPAFVYTRYNNSELDVIWEHIIYEQLVDLLSDATGNLLYAIAYNGIHIIPKKGSSDHDVRSIPFAAVYQASLDSKSNIYAVVEQDERGESGVVKHTRLVCIGKNRKTQWHYDLPSEKIAQPPSPLPDGKIYLIVDTRLLCVEHGNLVWAYEIPSTNSGIFMTVLKDETALIVTGPFLIKVTADGKEENRMVFEEMLTCRPVVDEKGLIYVAGTKQVYCVK